jgi:hypothetical protein
MRTISSLHGKDASGQDEKVYFAFLGLDLLAHFVDIVQHRDVTLDKVDLAIRVQLGKLCLDPVGLFLTSSYKIETRFDGVANEFACCAFPNTAGTADCSDC